MIFVSGFNMLYFNNINFSIFNYFRAFNIFFPEKFGYIFLRIKTFIDPKSGDNFQSQKALDAIKQGGLTGQGMGEGILKKSARSSYRLYNCSYFRRVWSYCLFYLLLLFFYLLDTKY